MAKKRSSLIQLSPIKEFELAAARVPGAVSLAQGIPSFDTPEIIKNYVKEKLDQGLVAKYSLTPGMLELREVVSESLQREGMRYDPDGEILITAGSIEAISSTLLALTEPGDEVILPTPCYASYQQAIRVAGCVPRFAPLDEERNFDLDVEAIASRITPRTAAIFYCNPNNPTGTIYSREQSLRMMELAERHGLLIITDEVYKDFIYTSTPYFSPAQVEAFRNRVVRIYSFSKAYAMTGWRVGYLHTARELATDILKVHDALVTCAPVISQHAAVAALEFGQDIIAEFKATYRKRRDMTLQLLDAMSHIFDYQKPNGAYFVFPRIKDTVPLSGDSRALAMDLLEKGRVALVPGIAFGPTGESHLRMSFGRDEQDIEEAFRRMRDYFGQRSPDTARVAPLPGAQHVAAAPHGRTPVDAGSRPGLRGRVRKLAVRYLSLLARIYLRRHRPKVIAVAGNRGKTVCKRILTELLERQFNARANPRSYNTEIGLPLAVLGLEINPRHWKHILRTLLTASYRALFFRESLEWLVLEMGVRRQGDMATLLRTVKPDWAVITDIETEGGPEPSDPAIMQEEISLLCGKVATDRLILSGDDELLAGFRELGDGEPMIIGLSRLRAIKGGWQFKGGEGDYFIGRELVGRSSLQAVQAAVLLGEKLGLDRTVLESYLLEISGPASQEPSGSSGTAETRGRHRA